MRYCFKNLFSIWIMLLSVVILISSRILLSATMRALAAELSLFFPLIMNFKIYSE